MAITDATRTRFKYGAALPDSNLVAGSFYIVAPNDSFLELYLATSVSSAQHIGALHSVSDVTGLPVAGNTDSLYFTNDAKGLYHWNGATYDKLNEGQTYTADEETLTLINNEFSVLDSGINTLQIADAAITNAKIANMNAYTMKANNTNAAFAPLDVALVDMILNGYLKTSDTGVIAASDTLAIALSRIENNTANVVSAGSSLTTDYLVQGSGNKNVTISSVLATNVVTQIANSTSGRIMISGGNKVITDSGITIASTITDNNSIVPTASAVVNYAQPLDETNLTQIAALTSGNGLLKKSTADNVVTWSFDTTAYLPLSQKGIANGVPTLDADGKVPSSQLPSYVDDVLDEISMCYAYSTAPLL